MHVFRNELGMLPAWVLFCLSFWNMLPTILVAKYLDLTVSSFCSSSPPIGFPSFFLTHKARRSKYELKWASSWQQLTALHREMDLSTGHSTQPGRILTKNTEETPGECEEMVESFQKQSDIIRSYERSQSLGQILENWRFGRKFISLKKKKVALIWQKSQQSN